MTQSIFQSARFQEDYNRYKSVIEKMSDGQFKTEVDGLLSKLVSEVKKLDGMHMEMVFTKQLPTMGSDFKENIISIRKQLENKIRDWQEAN